MATFFMFGRYSPSALNEICPERTEAADSLVKELGGEIKSMHTMLGVYDVVLILDMPNLEQAMQASVALTRLTGISFTTSPAIQAEKFDELIKGI
jgi:uncharacterized protein with GYD domain